MKQLCFGNLAAERTYVERTPLPLNRAILMLTLDPMWPGPSYEYPTTYLKERSVNTQLENLNPNP